MGYKKILLPALLAGFIAACGGSGGGTTPPPAAADVEVTLSAQVYDQAVSNAEVSVYVGDNPTPVGVGTTDDNGNFSIDLTVPESAYNGNCVVVARRDNISLRSLLGNVGAIVTTANENSGTVTAAELPSANITNVSTAVAAIIEQAGNGSLPSSQAEIDAAVAVIANDPAAQQTVLQIAAAIKSIVDYGGTELLGGTDTAALAEALAGSNDLAGDLATVIAASDATDLAQLVLEVAGDPLLATQLPSDEATLVAGLIGNTYVTNDANNEETLVRFDSATALTVADYSDIEAGGTAGTYVDNTDGSLTVTLPGEVAGTTETVIVTVTGGSTNAVIANINVDGVDEGSQLFRRMIPVGGIDGPAVADIANGILVDIDTSTALHLGASCNGTANDATLRSATGEVTGVTCSVAEGMIVITAGSVKTMHGLLADSWNGTTISQQVSVVDWKADTTLGSVASYSRLYTPIDAGTPTLGPVLRVFPSDASGAVGAQVRIMTVIDPAGDALAEGSFDSYNQNSARTKNYIAGVTTPLTGSLLINGSVNPGQSFGLHASTSIGINLGNNANSRINALLRLDGSILTRYQYKLSPITATDVAGKTFIFNDLVFAEDSGPVTFSADDGTGGGTATSTDSTGAVENFTWKIKVAPVATHANIASKVTNYGTTLSVSFADGTTDYFFGKKLGTSIVLGGYNVNDSTGAYVENIAAVLTLSDSTGTAPAPTPAPSALSCTTESGWNDAADGGLGAPITPYSFAEFESAVADCGTASSTFSAADIAGNTFNDSPELTTFNAFTGSEAGTSANPGSGSFNDTTDPIIDFKWYVETASAGHKYIVIYSDSSIDADLPVGYSIRDTSAMTANDGTNVTLITYSEGSNYGDMVRAVGSDGDIWTTTHIQQ